MRGCQAKKEDAEAPSLVFCGSAPVGGTGEREFILQDPSWCFALLLFRRGAKRRPSSRSSPRRFALLLFGRGAKHQSLCSRETHWFRAPFI